MQETVMLKETQVLPLTFHRVMYRARNASRIGETRTASKTNMKMKFFSAGFFGGK
jgi:hypothetical protein